MLTANKKIIASVLSVMRKCPNVYKNILLSVLDTKIRNIGHY